VAHLGALDFIEAKSNAVFLGPPGTGKSHLSIALGIRACLVGHRVAFATAAQWVDRLGAAYDAGRLQDDSTQWAGAKLDCSGSGSPVAGVLDPADRLGRELPPGPPRTDHAVKADRRRFSSGFPVGN
jgi:hypothetical protein